MGCLERVDLLGTAHDAQTFIGVVKKERIRWQGNSLR
jgi:hypothetical protein